MVCCAVMCCCAMLAWLGPGCFLGWLAESGLLAGRSACAVPCCAVLCSAVLGLAAWWGLVIGLGWAGLDSAGLRCAGLCSAVLVWLSLGSLGLAG